jgi:hypothetical protein
MDDNKRITISYRRWRGMLDDARHAQTTVEMMYAYSQECRAMATDWEETAVALDQALSYHREAHQIWKTAAEAFIEEIAQVRGIPKHEVTRAYGLDFHDWMLKEANR